MRSAEERELFQSMGDDERRANRTSLPKATIDEFLSADAETRASYLFDEALGNEEVWAAFENDYLSGWEDRFQNVLLTPIWPQREFAEVFKMARKFSWEPAPIPITDWVDIVTPDLLREDRKIALFPVDHQDFSIVDPTEMVDRWETGWKSFAKHYKRYRLDQS